MSTQESKPRALEAHLRSKGHDTLAEWVVGGALLTDLSVYHFTDAFEHGWVVRLSNDDQEKQIGRSASGDLIQINDGDRDGEFATPYQCWRDEFADYLFSGKYAVELIYQDASAFEVSAGDE